MKQRAEDFINSKGSELNGLAPDKSTVIKWLTEFANDELKAINYTHGCTELCECVEPFIEVTAEECSGCGMLIKGD